MYEPRFYRHQISARGLTSWQIKVKETDLYISASKKLIKEAEESILKYRRDLEEFIGRQPVFATTFEPFDVSDPAPQIVKDMAAAAKEAGVGPMAAVAGAIAEYVGRDLLESCQEVIVENGGDIFMKTNRPRKIGIYAGSSPLSNKVGFTVEPDQTPLGICTSAGTVGHSLSFGRADAVVALSSNTCLADVAATAVGNQVKTAEDVKEAISLAQSIRGLKGVIIIKDDKMGVWGSIKLVPLGGD